MTARVWCATGHRPDKLGGHSAETDARLYKPAHDYLRTHRPEIVISGMALGWDTAWANAAIPFLGQESRWPADSQRRYRTLLERASRLELVCPGGYDARKMQRRNEWMVDNSTATIALWDGSPGGTGNCVRYATKQNKPIVNLWDWYK